MTLLATNPADTFARSLLPSSAISANSQLDSLSERIRYCDVVRPIFVIGPPRTGTTLLAQILAHGDDVLSLSEPFFAWRILRPWMARAYFQHLRRHFRWKPPIPATHTATDLFAFLRDSALNKNQGFLVVKEVFHDFGLPPPWINTDLIDSIANSGAPVIAIIRDPFDAVASTLNLVRRYVCGRYRLVLKLICPQIPRFSDDDQILRHAAHNWSRFAQWVRRDRPLLIHYEDLTADPYAHIRHLCKNIDLPFDPRMIAERNPRTFAGLGDPAVLLHAPKPIHSHSIGRGRSLTLAQRSIVRDLCGPFATDLGYDLQP